MSLQTSKQFPSLSPFWPMIRYVPHSRRTCNVAFKPAWVRLSKYSSQNESKSSMPHGISVMEERVFSPTPTMSLYIRGLPFMFAGVHFTARLWNFQRCSSASSFPRHQHTAAPNTSPIPFIYPITILHFTIYYTVASTRERDRDLDDQKSLEKYKDPATFELR